MREQTTCRGRILTFSSSTPTRPAGLTGQGRMGEGRAGRAWRLVRGRPSHGQQRRRPRLLLSFPLPLLTTDGPCTDSLLTLSPLPPLSNSTGQRKNYAFITFDSEDSLMRAVSGNVARR